MDGTDEAVRRTKAVRRWFLKMMVVFVVADVFLIVAMVLDLVWRLSAIKDSLVAFGLGLVFAGILHLRDHAKARRPACQP